jgi:glucan phosphoethanolaminetransferase (alkaline phosphatase superfamily)
MLWKSRLSWYALFGLWCAPLAVMLIWSFVDHGWRSILVLAVSAVLVLMLIAGVARHWRRFALVSFPLYVLAIAYVGLTLEMDMVPGHAIALLLMSSAAEDMLGAVRVSGAIWVVPWLSALLCGYLWLAFKLPALPIFSPPVLKGARLTLAASAAIVAVVAADAAQLMDGLALDPFTGPVIFLAVDMPRARAELRGTLVHKLPYDPQRVEGAEIHVLVIGESARRDSWSVYGYGRETTPYLDSLRGETVFLQRAVADANLTEWSVPMMVTGLAPREFAPERIRGNLVDLAREAGYSTAWLINQDIRMATMFGIVPDRLDCPADPHGEINGRHLWDEVLLPYYQREMTRTGAPRFIGIHVLGSHWDYKLRYPPAFQRFGAASGANSMSLFASHGDTGRPLVDAYDNSVLYTDWFLKQVIEAARQVGVPATVTYFPDHGEDLETLDGQAGHGRSAYTPHSFRVPAFVWMNDAYRAAHPQIYGALQRNASKEIRTHNVFYTLAQLMGIRWSGNSDAQSFASDRFVPDSSREHIAGGILITRPSDGELSDKVAVAPATGQQ